ncbi:MAG: dynamin family protein [Deltaproteobacteria bacterium]|nr:dynamin family protein [Deltaproteobacteria bacterium]
MEHYDHIKNKLLDINKEIRRTIQTALSSDGLSAQSLETWHSTTERIQRQLAEETIRIAVVGSIKSGKSTLTNFLFGGDYVKRGAGVVTSIITKIRPGNDIKAKLEFKTWGDVNAEMNQALVLFSSTESNMNGEDFDINREQDRLRLKHDLSKLDTKQLISDDARDPNSVLLIEYLKGYERAKAFVSFERETTLLESGEFDKQKEFVSDESLAVYLRDVSLTLKAPDGFGENLEIADCQGSDSPNPLHLAMIQDYLIQTHLIIYALSSRTGLRQADIKFLTLMKKMGLAKNIIFVFNCDFTEHENLSDLKQLLARTKNELNMVVESSRVFAFSALYNLFGKLDSQNSGPQELSRKDRLRLEQWREETDMVAFSDQETTRFLDDVIQKVSVGQFNLLLEANVERLSNIASGMKEWIRISRDLLQKTAGEVQEAFAKMDKKRKASNQIVATIKDTLDGTTRKLKRYLGTEVDRCFDVKYGEIAQEIIQFINAYNISVRDYKDDLQNSGFLLTLYHIFQTLQQATNRFIAEQINPKIVQFIGQQEEEIKEMFQQVSGPYGLMIQDAVDQHHQTMEELGIDVTKRPFKEIGCPDIPSVKSDIRLSMPHLASTMQYSTRIKTEAILKLGLYNTLKGIKKLFRRPAAEQLHSAMRSLEHSVRRIKEQMGESIAEHFTDYKENLKFQYVFTLVDAMSSRLYESLTDQIKAFTGDLSNMKGLFENEKKTKGELSEELLSMERSLDSVMARIKEIQEMAEERKIGGYDG